MCGIVGLWDPMGLKQFEPSLVQNMNLSLQHRGPDDEGYFIEQGIALAHRRLSIIDLSHGHQPVYNEDNQIVVVFNGEIYNFKETKKQLEEKGHFFKTNTDTEVIVHAYEEWGVACLDHFRGMFAFLLWDKREKQLFVARDRLGVKPLYYAQLADGIWLFASELKAFYEHHSFEKRLRLDAVMDYFAYGYVPDPKTIFEQAYKLEAGHYLLLKLNQIRSRSIQYWDVPFDIQPQSEAQAVETLTGHLNESVNLRMIADVPLGAFLSGGIDSSAVVSTMASFSHTPIKTCSIHFDEREFDESEYATEVANQYHTEHNSYGVRLSDFSLLDSMHQIYDEPFADSSAIPTYRVCEVARKTVKVALSGDGGDEHFGGYRRYKSYVAEEALKNYLPYLIRRPVFSLLEKIYPQSTLIPRVLRARSTFKAMSLNRLEGYFNTVALCRDIESLFKPEFLKRVNYYHPLTVLNRHAGNAPQDDSLCFAQYLDIKTYLVGDILTKVDRASMAHGLEVREPLLDHKLVEWASSLPPDLKIHQGITKYIFKKALEPKLSHQLIYRKKKGFAVPLNRWFRVGLKKRILELPYSKTLESLDIFNRKSIIKIVKQHINQTVDHSALIWTLLVFENFIDNIGVAERRSKNAHIACA
ncbi:MAG: XrtA/PEP-CTERM system amidotransferase [Gammaproteobacteria bacterium]